MAILLFIAEIFLFSCGGMVFAYNPHRKISESLSLGIFLAIVLISLIFQVAFLLEFPFLSIIAEIILALLTIRYLYRHRLVLKKVSKAIWYFLLKHKIITSIVIVCWIYLFLLVAIIPPGNWDSMAYNLSRVFLFKQEQSLFLENVTTLRQSMFVVGADILNYGFLRFDRDYGVGIFSWLAYISVGLGTYGLSRTVASTQVSIATTLIIISLPEFCFQATSTKNDIFTAAAAVFCFIVADRLLAKPDVKNIAMLLLGIAYGFAAKTTFLAFLAPFGLCFTAIAFFKIGGKTLYKIIRDNWLYFVLLTAPIIIISQSWLFWHNAITTSDATGTRDLTGGNTIKIVYQGGILGGVANAVRYFFQSIDLFPLDYLLKGRFNWHLGESLTNIYEQIFYPIFGNIAMGSAQGKPYPFQVKVIPQEDFAWYGIFSIVVILPAILFSLFKGNYWLKVQSLSLLGFMAIVSYKLVWTPWNNRYVTLFFVASGACVAFFLQHITQKYQLKILNGIITVALILLVSASVLNVTKPLGGLSITEFFKPNIWSKTEFGSDRLYYARKHHRDNRIEKFRDLVADGSKVALLAGEKSWIYHFYLVHPSVIIVPNSLAEFERDYQTYDYLFCLDLECDLDPAKIPHQILWKNARESGKPGKLIQLKS